MIAPTLHKALKAVEKAWIVGPTKSESVEEAIKVIERKLMFFWINAKMRLDYVELNNSDDFEVIDPR
ncbi:hypothetical protein H0H93_008272 [Arthromyces matolae]|nr:hypothetical protein H0H93_008272 [Arthromyces matolae]